MDLRAALILFGCLVVAVIVHEVSHGVVALWCGDDTAKRAGRLTLNPIPHIDAFGSIILPAMGALTGLPAFGYAKPVPVDPSRMRNPRRGMLLVGLAGPATNLVLMAIAALTARWMVTNGDVIGSALDADTSSLLLQIVFFFALVNLLLGVFNLLPIPPLDGSALIERLLPTSWLPTWYRFRPYGLLVILGLVVFGGLGSKLVQPFLDALFDFVVR